MFKTIDKKRFLQFYAKNVCLSGPMDKMLLLLKGMNFTRSNLAFYQLPLILTALLHADLINVAYLTACAFIRS